jgi:GNAT superfamily N-acetyltransferase
MAHTPAAASSGDPGRRTRWNWVPVRSLAPRHRARIGAHLISLGERDRYLRFGQAATDAQIQKYVDQLDFDHDEIFGIFNRRLELIAMAHLAFAAPAAGRERPALAEFGVSVVAPVRGRGFGQRLFDHAVLHARNRGVKTLFIQSLTENTAMLRIARNAGAQIVRDGSEAEARVALPADNLASHLDEIVADRAAEFDYQLKVQSKKVNHVLDLISDVHAQFGAGTHVGEE